MPISLKKGPYINFKLEKKVVAMDSASSKKLIKRLITC